MHCARSCLAICISIALTACVTYDDPVLTPPSPVTEGLARANAGPACAIRDTFTEQNPARWLPDRVAACAPSYPQELLDAGIGAACDTLFDLDAAGVPQITETRCALTDIPGQYAAEWRRYAEAIFVAQTSRGISLYRFSSASPEKSDEIRRRLAIRTLFALDGVIPSVRPTPFENAIEILKPPAPPN